MTSETGSNKPVIVLGAGGHAKVVIDMLQCCGREIIGLTSAADCDEIAPMGIQNLGDDDSILRYPPGEIELANGIGAMPDSDLRRKLTVRMAERGYLFTRVIHPSAVIANGVEIGEGAQIMAGTVVQPGVKIGHSCIINTGVTVDHDCVIHSDCHLAPGVTICGNVVIYENTLIGTGGSIIQGITIGKDCIVAAGVTVYRDIPDNTRHIPLTEADLSAEQN